jgi:precorrin-4/cobalt-precorrin-4 C11-methyltransferase
VSLVDPSAPGGGRPAPAPAGLISFVGAGPGAADLVTLRGVDRLRQADLVIWASSLIPAAVLTHARPEVPILDSAGMTLEDVLGVYRDHPDARIVRLHSGDPSIYGALQEQLDWCTAQGRPYEIVPGVSSLGAAAAALGRELTLPGVAQSVVLTRLPARTSPSMPPRERVQAFAATGCTLAVFLSAARPRALQEALLAPPSAYRPDTPVAIVARASWPDEQVVRTTLGQLAEDLAATGLTTTVLVLVGDALAAEGRRSHLYAPDFAHGFRRRSLPGTTQGRPVRASGRGGHD